MSITIQHRRADSTGYVAINAAFLQEVKEAYSFLWDNLHRLREASMMQAPFSVELNKWVSMLADFRAELANEFSLEETYGYVTQAAVPYAGPCQNPAALRHQHAEMYLHISELCEEVELAQYKGTLMRDFRDYATIFREFDFTLRSHEREESKLIEYGLGLSRNRP